MLRNILNMLSKEINDNNSNLQAVFAGLLVRAARIDNDYTKDEKVEIERIIQDRFNISEHEAKKYRMLGEDIEEKTIDTVQITREIKKEIPFESREELVKNLWSIILTDKYRSDEENSFMRTCVKLIGVNDVDSAKARNSIIAKNEKS